MPSLVFLGSEAPYCTTLLLQDPYPIQAPMPQARSFSLSRCSPQRITHLCRTPTTSDIIITSEILKDFLLILKPRQECLYYYFYSTLYWRSELKRNKRYKDGKKTLFRDYKTVHEEKRMYETNKRLTLCDPMDRSPPGSPVPGILQARTLEWVAISFSNIDGNAEW